VSQLQAVSAQKATDANASASAKLPLEKKINELEIQLEQTTAAAASTLATERKARCAFSTEIYTRGCHWFPRLLA
jgi:hypothetical protein